MHTESGYDGGNFLHSSLSAVFWISDNNSIENTLMFWLCTCTTSGLFPASWLVWARSSEEIQLTADPKRWLWVSYGFSYRGILREVLIVIWQLDQDKIIYFMIVISCCKIMTLKHWLWWNLTTVSLLSL